jgi:uncharacterized protein YjbJ (UPF0337 family)
MDIPKTQSIGEEAAGMKDRAVGTMKDKLGEATGNPDLERRGEAQNTTGQARQASNTVVSGSAGDHYVTSFYADPAAADTAYGRLKEGDYAAQDIDVVMSDDTRRKYFGDTEMGSKAAEGLGVGGAVGGGVGAALAAVFAVGSNIVVPGLGLVVAGPIAAALAGAGAGAAAGGLIGVMVGAGIPEDRAKEYEAGIRQGGVLLGTKARDQAHAEALNRTLKSDPNSTLGLR